MPLTYDDSGIGLPLVLLHAFPLHRRMWAPVRAAMPGDVRLITPDLPGFGAAPPPVGAPSLEVYADAIAALLDELSIERAVVGGVSMGGYVTLAFARRHPDRVLALVLADTKADADTAAAADNRRRVAAVVTAEQSPRVLLEELLPRLVSETTKSERPEVVDEVRRLIEEGAPDAIAWAQLAMAARSETFDVLRGMRALVIVGADDGITGPADARALADAAGDSTLLVVPDAGHLAVLERPAVVAAALVEFARTVQ